MLNYNSDSHVHFDVFPGFAAIGHAGQYLSQLLGIQRIG